MTEESVTRFATCPLCEATCGLALDIEGDIVVKVRGDAEDVFSAGFICPKGAASASSPDPDRIDRPSSAATASSFRRAGTRPSPRSTSSSLRSASGERNATAVYLGNPNAHTLDGLLYLRALIKAIGTRNIFSATSVDQLPKQISCAAMFGTGLSIPIPDVDHTDYMLILGANPLASNGSLMTAPDMRGKLKAIRDRGGRVVVIDPRRTRTADVADEHHSSAPAATPTCWPRSSTRSSPRTSPPRVSWRPTSPASTRSPRRSPRSRPRPLPRRAGSRRPRSAGSPATWRPRRPPPSTLASAPRTQEFGTLASWLVDVINVLTGNLDRRGGAMFPRAAAGSRMRTAPVAADGASRWAAGRPRARHARGIRRAAGRLPGRGDPRPRRGTGPGAGHGRRQPAGLDAERGPAQRGVRLPRPARLDRLLPERDELARRRRAPGALAARTLALRPRLLPAVHPQHRQLRPPVLQPNSRIEPEWRTMLRLAGLFAGAGTAVDVDAFDDMVALEVARRETVTEGSPAEGMEPTEVLAALGERRGPERILDLMLRCGPYGAGFAAGPATAALSLGRLEEAPHGIDLGPLEPRLPESCGPRAARSSSARRPLVADLDRLAAALARDRDGAWSWSGAATCARTTPGCTTSSTSCAGRTAAPLQVHPDDAAARLDDGGSPRVTLARRRVDVPVEVTDAIMPGVVSDPPRLGPRHRRRAAVRSPRTRRASTRTCSPTRPSSMPSPATPRFGPLDQPLAYFRQRALGNHLSAVVTGDAGKQQAFARQIQPAEARVFIDVTQNIGQLQRAAKVMGEQDPVILGQAEHPGPTDARRRSQRDRNTDGSRHMGRTNVLWRVHLHAVDDRRENPRA